MGTKHSSLRFDPRAQPIPANAGPWDEAGGVVYPDNAAWDVVIGAAVMAGAERFRVVGDARIEGQTLGDSFRAEDTSGGTGAFFELDAGDTAAVSAVGEARLRYNTVTGDLEVSENGGAYVPLSSFVTLQNAYDNSAGASPSIQLTAGGGPIVIYDAAVPLGGDLIEVESFGGGSHFFSVHADRIDLMVQDALTSVPNQVVMQVTDSANSLEWWPSDRTFTSAQGALMTASNTYVLDYANVSIGGLNLSGTVEHAQSGFAFNHGLLFNHGFTYRNSLNVAANFGPLQGFIDQPTVQVNRNSAGAITMGQLRSFLSQPRFNRTSTNGTLAVTTVANFQGFGTVDVGASVTTWTRVQLGPFSAGAGTITNYRAIDIVNETQPTTVITGLRSAIASGGGGTRRNLEITGDALSTFAGPIQMNSGVPITLGTLLSNGVQLVRTAAGVLTIRGTGGANNEDLLWNFESVANNVAVTSTTGAGLRIGTAAVSIGTTSADPSANWQLGLTPGSKTITVAGDFARTLFTASANVTVNAALSTCTSFTVNSPGITIGSGSVVNAANMLIQMAPGAGTNRYGLLITSNPSGGTLNYAFRQSNASARARFDGRLDINRGIALGGGAAATLGTVGGAGPTAAAQAQWVEIDIGGVAHWIAVWI